ncbi:MAG: (2Fe-2S)-binding protein [Thermomicrobiales bacterium]|nr:(2Fe-2S)-binding protein [Thermomicrobiales bacterium]
MLCRCYEVTEAAAEAAIANGATTINDIKRMTRAGMGLCQGIYCVPQMTAMLAASGQPIAEIAPMTARPPARLISLAELEATSPEP